MDKPPKEKSQMSTSRSKPSHSALQPQLQEQAKQLRNTVRDPLATQPRSRTSGPHEVQPGDIFAESRTQEDMKSNKSGDGSGEENVVDERWMMGEGDTKEQEGEDLRLRDKKYVELASPPCYAPMFDED
ncbi:hypothetical protein ASPVEDRAFT_43644 [Aspergillus versicolor CBS 583.65]|uniref:Uncharacterized protein n=1 Tax=Aspergillus versicolor CBS 583.65 TaxID=1036611 RepID=A0A1L9PRR2_ASPVE|nr:uncharacterized protein ASPVEDRAFT_43644 [Aspergillus versicolor CBS 583.65]OJJ04181.1 hypothetical protein ASPVEDRAFT_43644 [Aspergillus versicolor CBS 583.65]